MDAGRNSNVLLESGRYAVRSVEKMVRFCVSSSNEVRFGLCNFVSLGVLHYARGGGIQMVGVQFFCVRVR